MQDITIEKLQNYLDTMPDGDEPYEFIPNQIVKFAREECYLQDANVEIAISKREEEFINSVWNPTSKRNLTRIAPRQTGGSTLIALIALYYNIKEGKNCVVIQENHLTARYFMRTLRNIGVFKHDIVQSSSAPEVSVFKVDSNGRQCGITEGGGIRVLPRDFAIISMRGYGYDYILGESVQRTFNDELLIHARAHLRSGGKIIINHTP